MSVNDKIYSSFKCFLMDTDCNSFRAIFCTTDIYDIVGASCIYAIDASIEGSVHENAKIKTFVVDNNPLALEDALCKYINTVIKNPAYSESDTRVNIMLSGFDIGKHTEMYLYGLRNKIQGFTFGFMEHGKFRDKRKNKLIFGRDKRYYMPMSIIAHPEMYDSFMAINNIYNLQSYFGQGCGPRCQAIYASHTHIQYILTVLLKLLSELTLNNAYRMWNTNTIPYIDINDMRQTLNAIIKINNIIFKNKKFSCGSTLFNHGNFDNDIFFLYDAIMSSKINDVIAILASFIKHDLIPFNDDDTPCGILECLPNYDEAVFRGSNEYRDLNNIFKDNIKTISEHATTIEEDSVELRVFNNPIYLVDIPEKYFHTNMFLVYALRNISQTIVSTLDNDAAYSRYSNIYTDDKPIIIAHKENTKDCLMYSANRNIMLNIISANVDPDKLGYWGSVVLKGTGKEFIYENQMDTYCANYVYITTRADNDADIT